MTRRTTCDNPVATREGALAIWIGTYYTDSIAAQDRELHMQRLGNRLQQKGAWTFTAYELLSSPAFSVKLLNPALLEVIFRFFFSHHATYTSAPCYYDWLAPAALNCQQ